MDTILEFGTGDDLSYYELPIYDGIKVRKYDDDTVRMAHPQEKGGMVFILSDKGVFVPGGIQIGDEKKVEEVCRGIFSYWESVCDLEVYTREGETLTKIEKVFPSSDALVDWVSDDKNYLKELYMVSKSTKVLHLFNVHSDEGPEYDAIEIMENLDDAPFDEDEVKVLLEKGKIEIEMEPYEDDDEPDKRLVTYKALTRKTIFS